MFEFYTYLYVSLNTNKMTKKLASIIALILLFLGIAFFLIGLFISNIQIFAIGELISLLSITLLFINKH